MLNALAPILVGLGAPILGSILRTNVGDVAGEASAQVIEALAEAFDFQPTPESVKYAIEAEPNAAAKVCAIERERSAEWVAYHYGDIPAQPHAKPRGREGRRILLGMAPGDVLDAALFWSWNGDFVIGRDRAWRTAARHSRGCAEPGAPTTAARRAVPCAPNDATGSCQRS
jgi:hypothetical protein